MPPAPKHIWKSEQVTFMLDELLLQVLAGKRCGQTVKKESWAIVMARFIRRFNCPIDLSKMKSKVQSQKSLFQLALRMKKLSGWGWDELKSRPDANPDMIAAFISALKATEQKSAWDIVKFGLPDYKLLSDLFKANLATGDLARGSNENNEPDPDPQDGDQSDRSSPFPVLPPTVQNPFADAGAGRHTNSISTPTPVLGDSGTSKRSAQAVAIGERPKRSHTNSAPSSAKSEFLEFNSNMKNVFKQISSGAADTEAARFGNIPPSALLTVQVAEKLNTLLTACNGQYDGETCKWLDLSLTFKYGEIFSQPHRAAMFLGTTTDAASVEYLCQLWEAEISPRV
ncbi:hypothetical protein BJ741DRAFT_650481 [Chytriomyces cf. hyalinus JEL632]|nr:hypothetical protein BJ741DRAFT_650481 [Chytriomyces cf. hyalinus JEL632]